MSSGVTNQMRWFSLSMKGRDLAPRETRPRDRSLRGKARRLARKAARS